MNQREIGKLLLAALVGGVAGGVVSMYLAGGKPIFISKTGHVEKLVAAEEFRLVGPGGKTRGVLGVSNVGGTWLVLYDSNGRRRADLSLLQNGSPSLYLWDQEGRVRVNLSLLADGTPSLDLADAGMKTRADLSLAPDGSPGLNLLDRDGHIRIDIGMEADEGPSVNLLDAQGQIRAVLGVLPAASAGLRTGDGHPASLVLLDSQGKRTWSAP